MDYVGVLTDLAGKFTSAAVPGASALEPVIQLTPPPELIGPDGALALGDTKPQASDVLLPLYVDLTFVAKSVRSATTDLPAEPSSEDPIGGMPVVPQLVLGTTLTSTLPPSQLMVSDPGKANEPGVPEFLGRIKGTVWQTVQRDMITRLPVSVAIRWRVLDESTAGVSVAVSNARYRAGASWTDLPVPLDVPTGGVPAPNTPLALSLPLAPLFSELTTSIPDVQTLSIRISVKLSVTLPAPSGGGPVPDPVTMPSWVDLPPLPVLIPTIPIPTILVLCEDRDFLGRKIVVVPSQSLVGRVETGGLTVGKALEITSSLLSSLLPSHPCLAFLAGTTGGSAGTVLKALVPTYKQTILAAQSRVDNLSIDQFLLDPGGIFGIGRLTGEDMASSIICVGRPAALFDMFYDRNLSDTGVTRLQVQMSNALGCAIRTLEHVDPGPDVVYGGAVTSHGGHNFKYEDNISSLTLTPPTNRFIVAST